ncbi:helix-turn-helix domain-containing protein [Neisseria sp.]|uniref:helix-turn-helix domain-containing protein n=1 Tax=Neisseria sp. TaxID=192066 RepID=UPI0026DC93A7|nr:helix-turn-helix transcriptional regulator [Neisseria sp.]MDO4907024.1 helix-turn-helix transcriptional regulator [Neisseria sp.]
MAVNDKVRALRELNNWSQEEMAERMNISESSYSRLERGESRLDLAKLEKLAAIFKIDIGELVASDGKGLICLNGENSGNHASYYINTASENLMLEIEKVKLELKHTLEVVGYKDQIIIQKDNEIAALKRLIEALPK